VEDICKLGDEMWVKCIGVDDKGRVRLSRKAAMAEKDAEAGIAPAEGEAGESTYEPSQGQEGGESSEGDGGERRRPRGDRGGRGGGERRFERRGR
jgi:polyribonucleotide nucleotidyltransferase